MNKGIILLVALMAFIAFANARPLMFFADQTDGVLGLSLGYHGIAYAWTTFKKGTNYHRVRFFGLNNINETLTDAWIQYSNGSIIDHLAVNSDGTLYYVLGDVRMNEDAFTALLTEQLYLVVATDDEEDGVISGYFRCRPHSGIAFLDASQVLSGSNSTGVGIGWGEITVSTIRDLPEDVLEQDTSIEANSLFYGRVVHNNTGTTRVSFHAPANISHTAETLANATLSGLYNDGHFDGVAVTDSFYAIDDGESYFGVDGTDGHIRGQIYPLLAPSHRRIPYNVDTVSGSTTIPSGGFSTLRFANQEGGENNANSYISLLSTAVGSNYTYVGVFYFRGPTNKKNAEIIRAFTVEMNGRITGTGSWLFEFFDSSSGEYIPAATWSVADSWTAAYIDEWDYSVHDYANSRRQLIMRVSVNSASQTNLYLDVFGVRAWVPWGGSNQALRDTVKLLNFYPGEYANGTVINQD
jgi:hypothetical protein